MAGALAAAGLSPEADLMARLARRGGHALAVSDIVAHLARWEPWAMPVEVFLGRGASGVVVTRVRVSERTRALLRAWLPGGTLAFAERAG
jgi:hypothetical protein